MPNLTNPNPASATSGQTRREVFKPDLAMQLMLMYSQSRIQRASTLSSTAVALLVALASKQIFEGAAKSTYPGHANANRLVGGGRSGVSRALSQLVDWQLISFEKVAKEYSVNFVDLASLAALPQYLGFMNTSSATPVPIERKSKSTEPVKSSPKVVGVDIANTGESVSIATVVTAPEVTPEVAVTPVVMVQPDITTNEASETTTKPTRKARAKKSEAESLTAEKINQIVNNPMDLLGYWLYGPIAVGMDPTLWKTLPTSQTNWAPAGCLQGNWNTPEPEACTQKPYAKGNAALTAYAWCKIQFARCHDGQSIIVKPANFNKMMGQLGVVISQMGLQKTIQIIDELCANWNLVRARVSWMKDLVLDENIFGKQPVISQVEAHISQAANAITSTLSDEDRELILAESMNVYRFLSWGMAGVKAGNGDGLAPTSTNWIQHAEHIDNNGEVSIIQHPEKWSIDQWCGWYWFLVCKVAEYVHAPMQMIFWDRDRTQRLYEVIQSTLNVQTPQQSYRFLKLMAYQFPLIKGLLAERKLTIFSFDENTPANKFVVEMTNELLTWSEEKIDDEYARVVPSQD